MAKRGTPKPITPGTLHNSFDRRSIIVGTLQGASASPWPRLGYIALFENAHYKMMSESNRVNLSLIPPRRGWIWIATASRLPATVPISASTLSPTG
jgi:penicillin-binding protein 2